MKFSTMQFRQISPTTSKILLAVAIASFLGSTSVTSAFARDDDRHQDNGWHQGEQRNERNDWNKRNENEYRDRHNPYLEYRDRHDPYHYSAPVYVPPVYYAPQPSPGLNFFFPLDFRHW